MNILLDTHALIWFITEDVKLPRKSFALIANPDNTCFVSLATYWEIGIKYSLGRLDLNNSLEKVFEIIEKSGFELLPITSSHILSASQLPFFHRDPFDRILIGQAINESLHIMTKDSRFGNYPVDLILVKEEHQIRLPLAGGLFT